MRANTINKGICRFADVSMFPVIFAHIPKGTAGVHQQWQGIEGRLVAFVLDQGREANQCPDLKLNFFDTADEAAHQGHYDNDRYKGVHG